MTDTVDVLAPIAVVAAVVTFFVQTVALIRLLSWPMINTLPGTLVHRGLLRTSICRVIAAIIYVTASTTIWLHRDSLPILSLTVYIFVQLLWNINAYADVRLRRTLASLNS